MEYDLKIRDLKLEEKNKGNRSALKERDDFKVKLENGQCFSTSKWSPNKQEMCHDKSCYRFGIESSNSMESNISFGDETLTDSAGNPEEDLKDYAIIDSGCSGSMTRDKDKLSDFKEFKVLWMQNQLLDYGFNFMNTEIHI
ncbi:hypothetical protein Tco_0151666 [Tanacetum coccineum]